MKRVVHQQQQPDQQQQQQSANKSGQEKHLFLIGRLGASCFFPFAMHGGRILAGRKSGKRFLKQPPGQHRCHHERRQVICQFHAADLQHH